MSLLKRKTKPKQLMCEYVGNKPCVRVAVWEISSAQRPLLTGSCERHKHILARKYNGFGSQFFSRVEITEEDTRQCSICHEPQFDTTSGVVCKNGHGGADSL
jgi:hypothetical protein